MGLVRGWFTLNVIDNHDSLTLGLKFFLPDVEFTSARGVHKLSILVHKTMSFVLSGVAIFLIVSVLFAVETETSRTIVAIRGIAGLLVVALIAVALIVVRSRSADIRASVLMLILDKAVSSSLNSH